MGSLVFWPSASRSPTSDHFAKILLPLVTLLVESCVAGHTPHDNPLGALLPQAEAYSGCMHCSGKPSNRAKLPDTMSNRRHFPTPGLPNPVATFLEKVFVASQVLQSLLNGDLRDGQRLPHHCSGPHCCASLQDLYGKLEHWLLKLLKAFKPKLLCRANWLQYQTALSFIALFSGIHRLLPEFVLRESEGDNEWCQEPGRAEVGAHEASRVITEGKEGSGEHSDDVDAWGKLRKEQREHRALALAWLSGTPFLESRAWPRDSVDENIGLHGTLRNITCTICLHSCMGASLCILCSRLYLVQTCGSS